MSIFLTIDGYFSAGCVSVLTCVCWRF